jgi:hypothetical protein
MAKHITFDWNRIEERIRPHVRMLVEAGYRTTASCGHDMWVTLDLEPDKLPDLRKDLVDAGYKDFEIVHTIHYGLHRHVTTRIEFGGDLAGNGKPYDFVLLKVDPESHPLHLVIRARRWPGSDPNNGHDEYFYNEHTCPTNWTDDIVAVISRGDPDPHGFAKFVRRVTPTDDEDEDNDPWFFLFPETAPQ